MPDPPKRVSQLSTLKPEAARKIKVAAGIHPAFVVPEAAAAMVPKLATKPGKERWPVKTGTDPDVDNVGKNVVNGENLGAGVVETTIEELVRLPRPSDMQPPTQDFPAYQEHRSEPVETTIWRIEADIIELKLEADGDYHLVLQGDSGETMIGEVPTPNPPFVAKTSPWVDDIRSARQEVDNNLVGKLPPTALVPLGHTALPATAFSVRPPAAPAQPSGRSTRPAGGAPAAGAGAPQAFKIKVRDKRAKITGVGFFDRVHGQDGVAQSNGIELHPILNIEWV